MGAKIRLDATDFLYETQRLTLEERGCLVTAMAGAAYDSPALPAVFRVASVAGDKRAITRLLKSLADKGFLTKLNDESYQVDWLSRKGVFSPSRLPGY